MSCYIYIQQKQISKLSSVLSLRSSLFRFLSGKRESREGSETEVTKKLVAGGRGREGKEKPAAEPRHFTKRP